MVVFVKFMEEKIGHFPACTKIILVLKIAMMHQNMMQLKKNRQNLACEKFGGKLVDFFLTNFVTINFVTVSQCPSPTGDKGRGGRGAPNGRWAGSSVRRGG